MALGDVWTTRRTGSEDLRCVAASATLRRWVVGGGPVSGVQTILTADDYDFDTWTARTSPITYRLNCAESDGAEQFVIGAGSAKLIESSGGITWSEVTITGAGTDGIEDIDYGPANKVGDVDIGETFIFVTAGSTPTVHYNDVPGTITSWAIADTGGSPTQQDMLGVAVRPIDKLWLAVCIGGNVVYRFGGGSGYPDGWQITRYNIADAESLFDVHYEIEAGLFVAVGNGGQIWTSATGLAGSWRQRTSPVTTRLTAVDYHQRRWIAVGFDGVIITSPDAINWTQKTSGTSEDLYGLACDSGFAIAVGDGGTILSSGSLPEPRRTFPSGIIDNADMTGDAVRRLISQFRSAS